MNEEEWNADTVVSHVDIHFDWTDRIRILFGKVAYVTVRTKTENAVGRTESETSVGVFKIFPRAGGPAVAIAKEG